MRPPTDEYSSSAGRKSRENIQPGSKYMSLGHKITVAILRALHLAITEKPNSKPLGFIINQFCVKALCSDSHCAEIASYPAICPQTTQAYENSSAGENTLLGMIDHCSTCYNAGGTISLPPFSA